MLRAVEDEWAKASRTPVQCRAMRVARVWSGVSKPTWAKALDVSPATISIYESRKAPVLEVRLRAAQIAGLPAEFMELGWDAFKEHPHPDAAVEERFAAIERRLDEMA